MISLLAPSAVDRELLIDHEWDKFWLHIIHAYETNIAIRFECEP